MLEAEEIDNVTSNRNLPSEFKALKPSRTQSCPKLTLGIGWSASH